MDPPLSKFSICCYTNRFGNFRETLIAFEQSKLPRGVSITPDLSQPRACAGRRKTSRMVNWRLRYMIFRRDNFRCVACGRSPATHPGTNLQIDHIIPRRAGGETEEKNLQTQCEMCNGGKSDLVPPNI